MLKSKVIIPLALLCSVGAAYIGRDYINELRTEGPKTVEEPAVQNVLISNFDLEIGRVISEADLLVKMWPFQ